MNLAKYSLDNTKIIYFFLAVLLIGGISSFRKLGKKEDAPFVIKSAVIMTRYPGAEPAEVERLITEPISREIQSIHLFLDIQQTDGVFYPEEDVEVFQQLPVKPAIFGIHALDIFEQVHLARTNNALQELVVYLR